MNQTLTMQNASLEKEVIKVSEDFLEIMGQGVQGVLKETGVLEVLKETMDFLECQGEMAKMERKENQEIKEAWEKRESLEIMVFLDFLV